MSAASIGNGRGGPLLARLGAVLVGARNKLLPLVTVKRALVPAAATCLRESREGAFAAQTD
jgi:hypothetical protein